MIYLLDTNTCIRHLTGRAPQITTHLRRHTSREIVVCSVVVAELLFGAAKSQHGPQTLARLQQFLAPYASLPFDDAAAAVYGPLRADLERRGTPIGPNDLMIASIAVSANLILVTNNTREFSRVQNLALVNWEQPSHPS